MQGKKSSSDVEKTIGLFAFIIEANPKDKETGKPYINIDRKKCADLRDNQAKLIGTKMREAGVPNDVIRSMGYE